MFRKASGWGRNCVHEDGQGTGVYKGWCRKRKEEGRQGNGCRSGHDGGGSALFDRLRELRTQIAKEEKVPPYIVFSDKTLTHMCVIKPQDRDGMLSVSGVGEFKYESMGSVFLNV